MKATDVEARRATQAAGPLPEEMCDCVCHRVKDMFISRSSGRLASLKLQCCAVCGSCDTRIRREVIESHKVRCKEGKEWANSVARLPQVKGL